MTLIIDKLRTQTTDEGRTEMVLTLAADQKAELQKVVGRYKTLTASAPKKFDVEIKQHRDKRSNDANSYLWVLCHKIAQAVNSTAVETYRQMVRDYGVWVDRYIEKSFLKEVLLAWSARGIGFFVELVDTEPTKDSEGREYVATRFYFGSSGYDTKEMSVLIDGVVTEAQGLEIETKTPDQIAEMKSLWGRVEA